MSRQLLPILTVACSLAASVAGATVLGPAGPEWGEPQEHLRVNLPGGEDGPLEQLQALRYSSDLFPDPPGEERKPPVWGSPLKMSWSGSGPVHCTTALAASYAVPDESAAASLGECLDGNRFRAWLRSGLRWRYTADAVLALDARWSPAGLGGLASSPPFQAAATVTVPW